LRFPRSCRLINKAEFKSVFDEPKKVSQHYLLALYKPNEKPYARLGIVVGKRVAKSAVSRNTIKRVLRESFRHNQINLTGLDIIVIARQQCDTLDKSTLHRGIDRLWEKLREGLKK
jgi:ribonuclease P protein component